MTTTICCDETRSLRDCPDSRCGPAIAQAMQNQIYDGYRAAIVERRLRSGQRVPSTHVLAEELGVSRIPVLNAYAQLLAEGYFESRVGSGTVVSRSLPNQPGLAKPSRTSIVRVRSKLRPVSKHATTLQEIGTLPWALRPGAFGVGQIAFDAFPSRIWSRLVVRQSRNFQISDLHYGDPMGSRELREAIATYLGAARSTLRGAADHDRERIAAGTGNLSSRSARS